MANKIILKKSSVGAKVPLATDLDYGELALNYTDGKLYFKNASNNIKSFTLDDSVVTLAGIQTLTNKTLTSPVISGGTVDNAIIGGTTPAAVTGTTVTSTGNLISSNSSGDEGGEILLAKPQTNSTIAGTGVTIDVYQNKLRIFEQGGSARGFYLDMTAGGTGVSTNIIGGGSTYSAGDGLSLTGSTFAVDSTVVRTTGDQTIGGVKTLSSNPILSAGTANGVAYLNGSKSVTTGSALTFDGSVFANTGVIRGTSLQASNTNGLTLSDDVASGYLSYGYSSTRANAASHVWYNGLTTELFRITSAGHVGFGITPSSWGGIATNVLEFKGGGHIFGVASDNYFSIGSNAYYDGTNWKYKTSGKTATMYHQDTGRHDFFKAPSGTAGGTISFAKVLTIDESGNLYPENGKIGPNASNQHILPAVSSDTFTLNAATQTLTNKTLTSPTINTSVVTSSTSLNVFNTTATTVNAFGAATALSIGASSGTTTVNNNVVVTGNLTVNGTTTTVNSTTITVDDILMELGSVATPTDVTAAGGGISLKGATDKTITWSASNGWTSSEDFNLASTKSYKINGTTVLNATTLGTGIVSSSLTSVGTIGTGTWQGSIVGSSYGGTGVNNGGRTLTLNTNSGTLDFTNSSTTLTIANNASVSGTNTGDQTITLTGDVTGSGTGSFATTLANTGVTANTYTNATVTVDSKGRITSASNGTSGSIEYVVKTSNYTATNKQGILADTSGGAFTITLPATPSAGAQVIVADSGNAWGTNNVTIGRNGSTINNAAEDLVCDITGASVQLVYDGTTWEVYVQIGAVGGNAATLTGTETLTNKTLTSPVISTISNTGTITLPTTTDTLVGRNTTDTLTNKTFSGPTVITDSSSSTALRITQTGTGNALVVEDELNPDSSPFVVKSDGSVGVGVADPTLKFMVSDGTTTIAFAPLSGLGYFGTVTNHPVLFATNSTERIRVTTNGGVSFGATGTAYGSTNQILTSAGDAPPVWSNTLTSPILNTATASGITLNDGYTEEVYAVVDAAGVALSPTNGSIQTWTLGASRTPTAGTWAAGQSMTLMINDGTAYTVTWTTIGVVWVGGTAPTLTTSGYTVIVLWKVGTTVYGALTGYVA